MEKFNKKTKILASALFLIFLFLFGFLSSLFQKPNFPTAPDVPSSFELSKTSNIVFTTDKKYKDYLQVAILSAILNKKEDSYYNIYVLGVDLSKKDIREIENLKNFKKNNRFTKKVEISVIPLKLKMLNGKIKHRTFFHHVSKADYFKFFMPEIFSSLNKILYLDCDILILGDLSALYNTNLENKFYAAARRLNYESDLNEKRFNIGVLLFNLDYSRKNNLTQKLLKTKNELNNPYSITQASFNKTVDSKFIQEISPIYNNRTIITQEIFDKFDYKKNYTPFLNDIKNLEELDKKTVIAHFADYKKPWFNPDMKFAGLWWKIAHMYNPDWKVEKKSIKDKLTTKIYNFQRRKK